MATYNKFQPFIEAVMEKVHNLGADTLKVLLTNSAPVATNAVKADLTEISAGNGYTAGGSALTINSSAQASGTYALKVSDVTFVAAGGSIGPFRYAVVYNDTSTSDNLICWHDYGSSITLADGESFTWDADQANGIFTAT